MRCSKITLGAAFAIGSLLSIVGSASATVPANGVSATVDRLSLVDQVQFIYGGRRHCWYAEGWHGPGWYWCGYHHRHGFGWGGEEGFRGWRHR
jgi:hypothetical protein